MMTSDTVSQMDYWHCHTGANIGYPHTWIYRRGVAGPPGKYLCTSCLLEVTKTDLKEHTDA